MLITLAISFRKQLPRPHLHLVLRRLTSGHEVTNMTAPFQGDSSKEAFLRGSSTSAGRHQQQHVWQHTSRRTPCWPSLIREGTRDWLFSRPEGVIRRQAWKAWQRLLQWDPNDPLSIVTIMTDACAGGPVRTACCQLHHQAREMEASSEQKPESAHENLLRFSTQIAYLILKILPTIFSSSPIPPKGDWDHLWPPAPSCHHIIGKCLCTVDI